MRVHFALAAAAPIALAACQTSTQSGLGGGGAGTSSSSTASVGTTSSTTTPPDPQSCAGLLDAVTHGQAAASVDYCADAQAAIAALVMCEQSHCSPTSACPLTAIDTIAAWDAACVACMSKPAAQGGCADELAACVATPCQ